MTHHLTPVGKRLAKAVTFFEHQNMVHPISDPYSPLVKRLIKCTVWIVRISHGRALHICELRAPNSACM